MTERERGDYIVSSTFNETLNTMTKTIHMWFGNGGRLL